MEDAQIVKLFSERKELALEETRLKYGEYCRVIAHNILGSEEDAEECINDALIRLWNIIPPHNPKSLKAMLGKITRNIALNRYDSSNAQKRGGGQTELVLNELTECFVSADNTFKIAEDEKFFFFQIFVQIKYKPRLDNKLSTTSRLCLT